MQRFPLALSTLFLTLALLIGHTPAAWAAPGDLDPSFDSDGMTTVDFGDSDTAWALALDSLGRIVLSGPSGGDFAVARLDAAGALDTTFGGGDGLVTIDIDGTDQPFALALDGLGRIILAGYTGPYNMRDIVVVRLNTDGTLDTSFDTDGKVRVDFGGSEAAYAVAVDGADRIVLGGLTSVGGDFAVARLNDDGTLDTSFDADGRAVVDFGDNENAYALSLDGMGRIVLAGQSGGNFAVARLNSDGSLDTSFDTDGRVTIDFDGIDQARGLALDGTRIVLGGYTETWGADFAVARLDAAGALDTSFGVGGKATVDFGGTDEARGVAVDADSRVVLGGYTSASFDFAVARLDANGALDATFGGGDGLVTVDFGSDENLSPDYAEAVALDGVGRILVSGNGGSNSDFAVARLLGGDATVGDVTPPVASPMQDPAANGAGWNNSDATVAWNWADEAGGSGIDPANCPTSSVSSGEGEITLAATCADQEGNTGNASYTVKVDKTPPTLNPVVNPNPVPLNGVATVILNAADALSGVATESCTAPDTSTVGAKSVTCTATDNAGNTTSVSVPYSVIYDFAGFFGAVDNPPVVNQMVAGKAVAIKFTLGGYHGLEVLNSVWSSRVACEGGATTDAVEETLTSFGGLSYKELTGMYSLPWKTSAAWKGTCRVFVLELTDGTEHKANFRF